MNWQEYWNKVAEKSDPYQQVARIGGRGEIGALILEETAARIAQILDLKPTDHVLDVCCGNGLLTQMILPYCAQITGVDISEGQIALAQDRAIEKIDFKVANATRLQTVISDPFDHIVLYFSFQYLETLTQAIASLKQMSSLLKAGGRILLGDVPEQEKLNIFYPKQKDRLKYELKRRWGRSLMGRFWSLQELEAMAHPLGLRVKRIEQPSHFPYAHYRADFLLEKAT